MEFYDALRWRYATKKMNGKAVPAEKVDRILEAIQLAPTSLGLQPFTLLNITSEELKNKILPVANGQTQITDGSHLLVFAAWSDITQKRIDDYIELTAEERKLTEEELKPLRNMLNSVAQKPAEEAFQWSARQAYIAFGFALAAAAVEEVDATPMEGFDAGQLDESLGLREKGLRSVLLLPLGYRDKENDWLAPMQKVRRPIDELVINKEAEEPVLA